MLIHALSSKAQTEALHHLPMACHLDAVDETGMQMAAAGWLAIPLQRLLPVRVTEEASRGFGPPDIRAYSLGPRLGIAVVAGGRNLHTPPPGVEGVMSPFNARVFSHEADQYKFGDGAGDAGSPESARLRSTGPAALAGAGCNVAWHWRAFKHHPERLCLGLECGDFHFPLFQGIDGRLAFIQRLVLCLSGLSQR